MSSNNVQVLDTVEKSYGKPTIAAPWNWKIGYTGLILTILFHLSACYGLYLVMTSAKNATIIFNIVTYFMSGIGSTAGAHRLWSHRSFKATKPLQIILMLFHSMSYQFTVELWVKQHRLHHRYCDTDADPHNASRGFFFSHIGWILVYPHDELKKRSKLIDMSDITSNPVLMFQKKYAYPLITTMCFILPTAIPMIFWGETFNNACHVNILRFILSLNATFLINSAAHKYGNKPYNKNILPAQNKFVSLVICGEGFHNYHHSFPWDYRAAELGNNILNLSTIFIDLFAYIGWAYDLKTVNEEVVRARAKQSGDGTDSWGRVKVSE